MSHGADTIPMLQVILEEIRELKETVKAQDEAIRGNGKPGLNQRVALIEERMKLIAMALLAGLPLVFDWVKRQLGWQ